MILTVVDIAQMQKGEKMSDRCYECTGYGDDYYYNDNGELVKACDDCPFNEEENDETD